MTIHFLENIKPKHVHYINNYTFRWYYRVIYNYSLLCLYIGLLKKICM